MGAYLWTQVGTLGAHSDYTPPSPLCTYVAAISAKLRWLSDSRLARGPVLLPPDPSLKSKKRGGSWCEEIYMHTLQRVLFSEVPS